MDEDTPFTLTVYSRQIQIGACSFNVADLLSAPRDNYNCVMLTGTLVFEGEKCGQIMTKLRLTDGNQKSAQIADKNNAKLFPNQPLNALTLPFTLKILSIYAIDIHLGVTEEYFYKNTMMLLVSHESWNKTTIACDQDMQMKTITAEWKDSDWLFIVTDARKYFEFSLICNNITVGKCYLFISLSWRGFCSVCACVLHVCMTWKCSEDPVRCFS